MKIKRLGFVGLAALLLPMFVFGAMAQMQRGGVRWDIISLDFEKGTISAGGVASALANDGSEITLTGRGIFSFEPFAPVSGGGEWTTFDAKGEVTGKGRYRVTALLSFTLAPGTPPPLMDRIGNPEDARAGLAVLRIAYSDGSLGVLTVSCHFNGSPDSIFEGITASKGFVDYWNRLAPEDLVDANRTTFHLVRRE